MAKKQRAAVVRSRSAASSLPFLLCLSLCLHAVAAASSTAVLATPIVTHTAVPVVTGETGGKENPVSQLATFVRTQAVRMKDGTVQLYTNHKVCNSIREKQRSYAELRSDPTAKKKRPSPNGGGITYEEYDFLQRGKEDRGKLGSLGFMMCFAPNFLPYAMMFNPAMMPSTFMPPGGVPRKKGVSTGEDRFDLKSRVRSHAVVRAMIDLEQSARGASSLANMNPVGKAKTLRSMQRIGRICDACGTLLLGGGGGASSSSGPDAILAVLERSGDLYSVEPLKKGQSQLVDVPSAVIMGLGRSLEVHKPPNYLTPTFLVRGQVLNQIKRVADADEFLVNQNVDLRELRGDLLERACSSRLIGGPGRDEDELRDGLRDWLRAVETDPRERISRSAAGGTGEDPSSSSDVSAKSEPKLHYNANLARAAIMCRNAVDSARDDRSASFLPRMMFQGSTKRGTSGGGSEDSGGKGRRGWR